MEAEQISRFVIIPKIDHPWFEEVLRGSLMQAQLLQEKLHVSILVEYSPPATATVDAQNSVLARVMATRPAGIAIDPVGDPSSLPAMNDVHDRGIPLIVFDSPLSDPVFPSVGNDFVQQGTMAAQRLVTLIGESGEVAVMQGVPTAPNHLQRFRAQLDVLSKYPAITIVDGGVDYDDIPTAERQAAEVLESHPHLVGYLCCDASSPIGIAAAIRAAGKVGKVNVVGMDGIEPILKEIKDGVLDSSIATIPVMQGSMALLMLWEASQGELIPQKIDTGIDVITPDNVDEFLAACRVTPTRSESPSQRTEVFVGRLSDPRASIWSPLILLCGINRIDTIERAIDLGFPFVAMARALLREPDLVNKPQMGSTVESLYIHCNKCMPTIYSGTRCVLIPEK